MKLILALATMLFAGCSMFGEGGVRSSDNESGATRSRGFGITQYGLITVSNNTFNIPPESPIVNDNRRERRINLEQRASVRD